MLDWEGNMQQRKDHLHRIIFDDVEDDLIWLHLWRLLS